MAPAGYYGLVRMPLEGISCHGGVTLKPIPRVKDTNLHKVWDIGLYIDPVARVLLGLHIPDVHILCVAVGR